MSSVLALLSSLCWGTSDYLGGSATRRLGATRVMLVSQLGTLPALLIVFLISQSWHAPLAVTGWAVGAGLCTVLGLGAFYTGLAQGQMGVVAPVAASGVILPVIVGVASGEKPSTGAFFGIVLVVLGVIACAGPSRSREPRQHVTMRPILYALVAALGFGTVFICLAHGSRESLASTLLQMRLASVFLLLVFARRTGQLRTMPGAFQWPIFGLGYLDLSANALFAVAGQHGDISIVAVLASLYPAVTMMLAWKFDHERLDGIRRVGVALALVGVAVIGAAAPGA
jgi:drug/metabolite transporter (DMT)-like permease